MPKPVLKAFILCDDLRQYPDKADLFGAGMGVIKSRSTPAFHSSTRSGPMCSLLTRNRKDRCS